MRTSRSISGVLKLSISWCQVSQIVCHSGDSLQQIVFNQSASQKELNKTDINYVFSDISAAPPCQRKGRTGTITANSS